MHSVFLFCSSGERLMADSLHPRIGILLVTQFVVIVVGLSLRHSLDVDGARRYYVIASTALIGMLLAQLLLTSVWAVLGAGLWIARCALALAAVVAMGISLLLVQRPFVVLFENIPPTATFGAGAIALVLSLALVVIPGVFVRWRAHIVDDAGLVRPTSPRVSLIDALLAIGGFAAYLALLRVLPWTITYHHKSLNLTFSIEPSTTALPISLMPVVIVGLSNWRGRWRWPMVAALVLAGSTLSLAFASREARASQMEIFNLAEAELPPLWRFISPTTHVPMLAAFWGAVLANLVVVRTAGFRLEHRDTAD